MAWESNSLGKINIRTAMYDAIAILEMVNTLSSKMLCIESNMTSLSNDVISISNYISSEFIPINNIISDISGEISSDVSSDISGEISSESQSELIDIDGVSIELVDITNDAMLNDHLQRLSQINEFDTNDINLNQSLEFNDSTMQMLNHIVDDSFLTENNDD